jgi:tetraprenyl-beta-curcumene synthase
MPQGPLREDALSALSSKRGQSEGAAFFSILPRSRNESYLRFLVAYQVAWDYLDSVSERGAAAGVVNGRQLHLALIDAVDPERPLRDYYRYSPWKDDGGYLDALVEVCRGCCERLPSYSSVRELVLEDAQRAQVLALNHEPDPLRRTTELREWVSREFPEGHEAHWYELTGAASAGLAAFALLALACEPECPSEREIQRTHDAYFPWVSAAACMLDSFVDQPEDEANGDHSYVAYYVSTEEAATRTSHLLQRCLQELRALPNGETHALIAACMTALYLSKDSARSTPLRALSRQIAAAGGSLTRLLLPVLRLWRAAHSLHSQ